jgi:hypothetical protein
MTDEPLHGKKTDADYLLALAKRLRNVPPMYGVDGFDIDCLADLSTRMRKTATPTPQPISGGVD